MKKLIVALCLFATQSWGSAACAPTKDVFKMLSDKGQEVVTFGRDVKGNAITQWANLETGEWYAVLTVVTGDMSCLVSYGTDFVLADHKPNT
jgi:hypothetical protein